MDGTRDDLPEQPKLSQVNVLQVEPQSPSGDSKKSSGSKTKDLLTTIAGVAGNVLEWYDFAVFGFFSDIISQVFFPKQTGNAALIESFVIFGGAFFMRPVGGLMMGYIGDKHGRKRALEMSILLMSVPTFIMGCLPSYDRVGGFAIFLLVVVRLLQGLSVGGQLMSSLVFTLEGHEKKNWGLMGSYVMAAANFGTLLGGIVAYILRESLSEDQLIRFGWRIPFLSGITVGVCGIYLRYAVPDDYHLEEGVTAPPNPLRKACSRENLRSLFSAMLVPMLWSGGFYLTFVWMAIFMADLLDPPVPNAFGVNSSALFISVCLLFPIAGILSDRFGRRPVMTIGGLCMMIVAPSMIVLIGRGNPWGAFFGQSIMGISLSFWGGPMMAWLVESFSPEARLTSVAIGYNIAQATVGGFTPAAATALVSGVGPRSPGLILAVVSVLSMIGLWCAPPAATAQYKTTSTSASSPTQPDVDPITGEAREIA